MHYRHSLRFRIILSYLVFGIAIGGLLVVFLLMSLNELETQLVSGHVSDEMQYFIKLTKKEPGTHTLRTKKLAGFKVRRDEHVAGYEFLSDLPVGVSEVKLKDREYIIAVAERVGARYYMLYDTTDFKIREHFLTALLLGAIFLTTVSAAWFGYWLSGKLIAPVTQLAQEVETMPALNANPGLSAKYANDEVGRLAKAFDAYMERLEHFIQRERSFTTDASHELRTPLSVIQGAVEVLLARDDISEQERRCIERIERAAGDMGQNLAALLILAREPASEMGLEGETDIASAVDEAVRKHRPLLAGDKVRMESNYLARPRVATSGAVVSTLVGNLIRNASRYTQQGLISIQLDETSLVIEDTGIGIHPGDLGQVFKRGFRGKDAPGDGSGFGLSIVKRICDHYGWTLHIDSSKDIGTRVTWSFAAKDVESGKSL